MPTLLQLQPGTRFEILESDGVRGTLIQVSESGALVALDADNLGPRLRDFQRADGQWRRIKFERARRIRITAQCRVRILSQEAAP